MTSRIVCLSPYPPNALATHAGGVFLRSWLEALSAAFDVLTVFPSMAGIQSEKPVFVDGLACLPIETRSAGVVARVRAGSGPSRDYLQAITRGHAARYLASADLIETQWPTMLGVVPAVQKQYGVPMAHVAHDLRTEALRSETRLPRHPAYALAATAKLARVLPQERWCLRGNDLVWCFKESDAEYVRRVARGTKTQLLAPVFPRARPPKVQCGRRHRGPKFIFVGDLGRHENRFAISDFVHRVWAQVRARLPYAEMSIVGARPGNLARYDGRDGIRVVGWVERLEEAYAAADIAIAPLSVRGGIKFKIAEAIAYGLPVVASPVAAEGYSDAIKKAIYIAESTPDWVRGLDALGRARESWTRIATQAQAALSLSEDHEMVSRRAVALYGELAAVGRFK